MQDSFNHIQHAPLKHYNRAVMSCNIREDMGEEASKEYLTQFSKEDKLAILGVLQGVKKVGVEEFKRRLQISMPLQEAGEEEGQH